MSVGSAGDERTRIRFEGYIAGLGSTSGTRLVVGCWERSPLGAFADLMIERPDGHRLLIAPSARFATSCPPPTPSMSCASSPLR